MKRFFTYFERRYYQILRLVLGKRKRDSIRNKKRLMKAARRVQEVGPEIFRVFSQIVQEEKCEFWPFWGTLLGAYREKGFIKHDDDIDVGMFSKDIGLRLVDKMIEKGFVVLHVAVDKDFKGGLHLAFKYKDVKFDIYSFDKDEVSGVNTVFCPIPYNYAKWGEACRTDIMDILHVKVPGWKSLIEIPFEDGKISIPSNTDEILKVLYGVDYMKPMPGIKAEQQLTENKIHEDPKIHYACMMSYEVYKMIKKAHLL